MTATSTTAAFLCYCTIFLCLLFSETTRTHGFSFVTVHCHRPIATTANSWCTSHKEPDTEGDDHHATHTCHCDNVLGEEQQKQHCQSDEVIFHALVQQQHRPRQLQLRRSHQCYHKSQQQQQQPTSSRRKCISSTIAGFAAVITSSVVTPQPKHAFASNGNRATASFNTNVMIRDENGRTGMTEAEHIANPNVGNPNALTLRRSWEDPLQIDPQEPEPRTATSQAAAYDRAIVRQYAGAFLEKMLGELDAGEEKGAEHVFRNLALYLSPPVAALDGGGVPLARLRDGLAPGVAAGFDALGLGGARLADAALAEVPFRGASAHDPGRVLVRSAQFGRPSDQVDAIFASVWAATPLEAFKVGR